MEVTREDLAVLYNPRSARYSRVYQLRVKHPRFKAKVGTVFLGIFREERVAAIEVIRYLKQRYGSRWKDVARKDASHVNSHSIRKGRKLRERGAYLWVAEVYVSGKMIVVTDSVVRSPGWLGDGWASREDAVAACRAFKELWGLSDSQGRPLLLRV